MMQTLVRLDKEVNRVMKIARISFPRSSFPEPTIKMDLTGASAGGCWAKKKLIRFNITLMMENKEDFIKNTVPHEVAHYVTDILAPECKPHGREWKAIMKLFGVLPVIYHNYETTNVRRVKKPYLYKCSCRDHYLSKLKHKRAMHGVKYECTHCYEILQYTGIVD